MWLHEEGRFRTVVHMYVHYYKLIQMLMMCLLLVLISAIRQQRAIFTETHQRLINTAKPCKGFVLCVCMC